MNKFTGVLFFQSIFIFPFICSIESYRVEVTIEPAGANYTQTQFEYNGIETFDSRTSGVIQSNFGTNGVLSGTYTGGVTLLSASDNAGANGRGQYLAGSSNYELLITTQGANGINYFGLSMNYVTYGESLEFFNDEKMMFDWKSRPLVELLNSGKSTRFKDYFGNPWKNKVNSDNPYMFVNFYFYGVTINKIKSGGSSFSDNHVIGWFTGRSGLVVQEYESPTSSTSSTSSTSTTSSTPTTSSTSSASSTPSNLSTSSTPSTSATSSASLTPSNLSTSSTSSKQLTSSKLSTELNSTLKNQSGVSIGIIVGFLIIQMFQYL